jgi:hypothetical protein
VNLGLTDTLRVPIAEHVNVGTWRVTATIGNTTSSVEVLVSYPLTPSFDVKAIWPRFLLRTDKILHGAIEIGNDHSEPIFGDGLVAIGQINKQKSGSEMMKMEPTDNKAPNEDWRKWEYQKIEISGLLELNYNLLSSFHIDVTKATAVQIYVEVTDRISRQERVIRHVVPVSTCDIIYEIRPLEFTAGMKNEFEIIAKRPDGTPIKIENIIVTVRMIIGDEQGKQHDEKLVEIKDFYTRYGGFN